MYRIRVPYSELLIKAAFFLFFFFTFFPVNDPFPKSLQDIGVENISESNFLNQFIKIIVFLFTFLASIYKSREILNFIVKEKFLMIFLLWSFLSIFWSDFPIVTFKRWFQILLIYFLIITFLNYFDQKQVAKILKIIIFFFVGFTLFSIIFIPGAIDPNFNTWRGFSGTKNTLGQNIIISIIILIISFSIEKLTIKKYEILSFILLSSIILIGTFSSTSYIAIFILFTGTVLYLIVNKIFKQVGLNKPVFLYIILTFLILFVLILLFIPGILDSFQNIFGKSETFYDRGKLWTAMLWYISQHPILGCGFQSFWTLENPQLLLLYQSFIWLPNQAHNGYLDLLNEVGIIGLVLFFVMLFKNIVRSIKYNIITPWLWFLIIPLITNITESNFMRVGPVTPSFIILSYLILEKIINERKERDYV